MMPKKVLQAVDGVLLARQRRGQVEPEAVDVHFGDPVAQAVHDEVQHDRMRGVEGVSRSCVVDDKGAARRPAGGNRCGCRCREKRAWGLSWWPSPVWL